MSSAALSGIDRDTLFHFEPANTVHGSLAIKAEIAFDAFTDSGYVTRSSKCLLSANIAENEQFRAKRLALVRVQPGEGFGKAADTLRMPHPRGSTESQMRCLEFVLLAVAWPAVTYAAIFPAGPATAGILAISGMSAWGVLQALRA